MNQKAVLFPMIALFAWTFAVLLFIPYQRFKASWNKQVRAKDFKFGESANVPSHTRACPLINYSSQAPLSDVALE
jgi:hypothetical protein